MNGSNISKRLLKQIEQIRLNREGSTIIRHGIQFELEPYSRQMRPPEIDLIEAVRYGAKHIVQVTMNEGKAIRAIPGQIKTFFTHGLGGCQATLVLAKCKDGNPLAILTHFDPISIGANVNRLKQLIGEHRSMIDPKATPKVFFSVPTKFQGEKYEQEVIRYPEIVDKLRTGLKEALGDFEETVMPYTISPINSIDKTMESSKALIANFNHDNPCKVSIEAAGNHFKNIEL